MLYNMFLKVIFLHLLYNIVAKLNSVFITLKFHILNLKRKAICLIQYSASCTMKISVFN